MQTLCGRVAVVVATSDGVGAAIARCFGELGASVVVNYASDQAGAERVVAKIVRSWGRAVAFQSDMANEADFGNAVSCARLNFGNPDFVFDNTRVYLQDVSAPGPEDYLSELHGYFAQAAGANPAFGADLAHIDRVSMLGELVASISHELAQPIMATTNSAKASLRWLQRAPPNLTEVLSQNHRPVVANHDRDFGDSDSKAVEKVPISIVHIQVDIREWMTISAQKFPKAQSVCRMS